MLKLRQPRFHPVDGVLGVFTKAHHHDAAHGLALPVQVCDPPTHLWPETNLRHVLESQGRTAAIDPQGNIGKVFPPPQVTRDPHHVFGLRHLHHRGADLLVATADGILNMGERYVEGPQLVRVHGHLVLPDHTAHCRHLGDAGHTLQLVL